MTIVLNNTPLSAKLHLLELPSAFDAIAGLDWLDRHGVHINARARTVSIDGADGSVGMRVNVAGCASISHGLPTKEEGMDKRDQRRGVEGIMRGVCRNLARGSKIKRHSKPESCM